MQTVEGVALTNFCDGRTDRHHKNNMSPPERGGET
jgi:hypothetical protein